MPHAPLRQMGEPLSGIGHAVPHLPQFAGSLSSLRHCLPQTEKPELHATAQLPFAQIAEPFWGWEHAVPHSPQFAGSLATLTHEPPQFFCPALQFSEHTPPEHACPLGQALRQAPQFAGS